LRISPIIMTQGAELGSLRRGARSLEKSWHLRSKASRSHRESLATILGPALPSPVLAYQPHATSLLGARKAKHLVSSHTLPLNSSLVHRCTFTADSQLPSKARVEFALRNLGHCQWLRSFGSKTKTRGFCRHWGWIHDRAVTSCSQT
jgi:hypothetical protein